MHIPAVEKWERLSPALVRPPTFPADLPFVPGFAAE